MTDRYTPVSADATVFRLVEADSDFLPPGHRLPLPRWLEPTSEDKREAERTGRTPGVSVWDDDKTTVEQAWSIRREGGPEQPTDRAFAAGVEAIRETGTAHGREVDVVTDPEDPAAGPGWEGHSLIEGLKRPTGTPRPDHKAFMRELVKRFWAA